MGIPETILLIVAVPVACVTVVSVMIVKGLFGLGKPKREVMEALDGLRADVQALHGSVQRLEKRMETVEAVVASSEYQARQRLAAAMETQRAVVEERERVPGR